MKNMVYKIDDEEWVGSIEMVPLSMGERLELTEKLQIEANDDGEVVVAKMSNIERTKIIHRELKSHIISVDLTHKKSEEKIETIEDVEYTGECHVVLINALTFLYHGKRLGKTLKP